MNLEYLLCGTPADQWIVEQVVVLDWHDGPRHGFCALAQPHVEFIFDLVDELHNPDGLDMRVFRLKEIPCGSVRQVVTELQPLGGPCKPIWAPVWKFPAKDIQDRVDTLIGKLESQAKASEILVTTPDMQRFLTCEKATPEAPIATRA